MKKNIAFICVHNSCRNQIAEALGKKYAANKYNFYSAGTEVKSNINKDAIRIMKDFFNIDMTLTQYPKTINKIPNPDIVISMGCDVGCPYIKNGFDDNWNIEDPTGKDDEAFIKIINQIKEKIFLLP